MTKNNQNNLANAAARSTRIRAGVGLTKTYKTISFADAVALRLIAQYGVALRYTIAADDATGSVRFHPVFFLDKDVQHLAFPLASNGFIVVA